MPIHEYFDLEAVEGMLKAPVLKEDKPPAPNEPKDISEVLRAFNTIQIKDNSPARFLAEGGWARLLIMEASFSCMTSVPSTGPPR